MDETNSISHTFVSGEQNTGGGDGGTSDGGQSSTHTYQAVKHKRLAKSPLLYMALIITFGSLVITGLLARSVLSPKSPGESARAGFDFADLTYLYENDFRQGDYARVVYKSGSLLDQDILYVLTFGSDRYELQEATGTIEEASGSVVSIRVPGDKSTKEFKLAPNAIFFLDTGEDSLATLGRGYAAEFFDSNHEALIDILWDEETGEEVVVAVYLTSPPEHFLNIGLLEGEIQNKNGPTFTLTKASSGRSPSSTTMSLDFDTKIISLEKLL